MRAAYSRADGAPGAEAARSLVPDAEPVEVADGVTALRAVAAGEVEVAVVAIEDSVRGLRVPVVDHLVFDEDGLFVTGVVDQQDGEPAVTTRFAAVGTEVRTDVPSPQMLLFVVTAYNRPGSLAETLSAFSSRGINVDRLDSRPLAGHLGMYGFLLEAEGTPADEVVQGALADVIHATSTIKFLGTFPAASRSWGHVTGREVRGLLLDSQAAIAELGDRYPS